VTRFWSFIGTLLVLRCDCSALREVLPVHREALLVLRVALLVLC
jgi:hypothetical protein